MFAELMMTFAQDSLSQTAGQALLCFKAALDVLSAQRRLPGSCNGDGVDSFFVEIARRLLSMGV